MSAVSTDIRTLLLDGALLLSIPLGLVVLHLYLPEAIRSQLAFSSDRFVGYTLLTSAYIHDSTSRLTGAVLGYVVAAGFGYGLSARAGARRWFRWSFLAMLVVLPILTTLTRFALVSVLTPENTLTERGFVDVAAGFGGLLLVAEWAYLTEAYGPYNRWDFLIGGVVSLIAVTDTLYRGRIHPVVLWGSLLFLVTMFVLYVRQSGLRPYSYPGGLLHRFLDGLLVFVLLGIVVMLLPADVELGWQFATTVADTAGLWYGFLLGAVIWISCPRAAE